ncbi:hypothetical protein SK128_023766, partial [Halocaridina rubra]
IEEEDECMLPEPMEKDESSLSIEEGDDHTLREHVEPNRENLKLFVTGGSKITVPCSSKPRGVIVSDGGQVLFRSPRYPKVYPKLKQCGWKLRGDNANIRFSVSCGYFRLENPKRGRCIDYLRLGSSK